MSLESNIVDTLLEFMALRREEILEQNWERIIETGDTGITVSYEEPAPEQLEFKF